ncbi:MAG TPA: histidine kinase [Puia sp.]|uniref:sensor histidine kinase n=1 Tax=Puia sp. TaxID=2045100 RepID=UPI002B553291|nr:histidine kinase [Puia sp.]HVU96429.1 histidine kinase [Puia sp.]
MRLQINKNASIHVLVWSLLTLLPFIFFSNPSNHYSIGAIPGTLVLIMGSIHISLFYTQALWLYPRFFNRRYWWLYILAALIVIAVSIGMKFAITSTWFSEALTKKRETYGLIVAGSIDIFAISLVYSRIRHGIRADRRRKELEAAQLATELKFLRSQISPHFLFNVLTNMVSLARKRSDQLESALITLSELMRYMLYDTQGKKMPLSTEIRYLNSYIELQKMRFGQDVNIETSIDAGPADSAWIIEPMLLIPFVENAFKHGVGAVDRPRIVVRLSVKDGWMHFEVRNTYDETISAGKEEHTGLGLNNVLTRLKLLYPGTHTLTVSGDGQWFQIVLTLKLI